MKREEFLKKRKNDLGISYETISARSGVSLYCAKKIVQGYTADQDKFGAVLAVLGLDKNLKEAQTIKEVLHRELVRRRDEMLCRVVHSCLLEEQSPSGDASRLIRDKIEKELAKLPKAKLWQ